MSFDPILMALANDVAERAGVHVEPAENDIPKVFINGNIPTAKDDVLAELDYVSKTESFHAYLKIKCQGDSSMFYPKKNFTIKLYSDEDREVKLEKSFKDWGHASNKFVLKANYIDHTHARNIVSANLWHQTICSRNDYDSLPKEMRNSPRNGAVDGFPIKVYTNGTYQGIYTWNIPKDSWMWGMDEDNPNHVLLCAETNTNEGKADTPCNFRALWDGVDGDDWSVEVGENSAAVRTSLNNLISFVMNNDGESFVSSIGGYLDIQSAIDYYIHQYVICGLDGLAKNMLLATYDGTKWICGAYDMDSTFGLWWDGKSFVSAEYRCPEDYQERYSLLWKRIESLFTDALKARYAELRKSVYSFGNIVSKFEQLTDLIGTDLYKEDVEIYSDIPMSNDNNIKQIRNYVRDRLAYVDEQINGIQAGDIFNGTSLHSGFLRGGTGEVGESTTDWYTDFISCANAKWMKMSFAGGIHSNSRVVFYDENGNFVSSKNSTGESGTIVQIPDTAKYFRLSVYGAGTVATVQLMGENVFDVESVKDGAYSSSNLTFNANDTPSCTVEVATNDSNLCVVDYIWGAFFIDEYDSCFAKVGVSANDASTKLITIPSDASKIAFCTTDNWYNEGVPFGAFVVASGTIIAG